MDVPRRTARCRRAVWVTAGLLLALSFLLPPPSAQAQSIHLTATPGHGKVTLTWTHAGLGENIRWRYGLFGGGRSANISLSRPTTPTMTTEVTGLTNGQIYEFHVTATRAGGAKIATSNTVRVMPHLLTVTATGEDSSIRLQWQYHGNEVGSHWEHQTFEGTSGAPWKMIGNSYAAQRGGIIRGLTNGRTYNVAIRYLSGGGGSRADSVVNNFGWVSATPRGATPTLASSPSATVTPSTDPEGTLVCYNLTYAAQGSTTYLETRPGKTAVAQNSVLRDPNVGVEITAAPAGITKGRGVNLSPCVRLGVGTHTVTWSWKGRDGTAATPGTTSTTYTITAVPAKPTGLTGTPSVSSVALSWNNPNDASISRWEIDETHDGHHFPWRAIRNSGAATTSYTVPNLRASASYSFKIRAVNAAGAGPASDAYTVSTTAPPVPAKPTEVSATAGVESVTLAWKQRSVTVRLEEQVLRWEYQQKAGTVAWGSWTVMAGSIGDTVTHTVSGLTAGTSYQFRVRAVNIGGNGTASDAVTAVPRSASGATVSPLRLTVVEGRSGTYTVALDTAPTNTVTVTVGGTTSAVTVDPAALTFTTANYSTAKTVTVNVAIDDNAESETVTLTHSATGGGYGTVDIDSVRVSVTDTTPKLTLPTDPVAVREGTDIELTVRSDRALTGTKQVRLQLTGRGAKPIAAADITGGLGPRVFDAVFGDTASTTGTVSIPTATDTAREGAETYTITLDNGPPGSNYVAATLSDLTAEGTLLDGSAPAKPTGLSATAGNGQVVLAWTDPANDAITDWQYQQKQGAGSYGAWTDMAGSSATTTSHTVTGLMNGNTYAFKIRARNGTANGAASAEAMATLAATATLAKGVTLSTGTLSVAEGDSGTYTVKLDKAPSATVTITIADAAGDDVTVDTDTGTMGNQNTLTFSTTNWETAQTVTVAVAIDADTTDDADVTLTHSASSSDTGYGSSLTIGSVTVSSTDTTPLLTLPEDPVAVAEGTDITLKVRSDRALTGPKQVRLQLTGRGAKPIAAADITGGLGPRLFDADFGDPASTTGTVSIPTATDTLTEGAETYTITLNNGPAGSNYVAATLSDLTAEGTLNDPAASTAPAAPENVQATPGNRQVVLSWDDPGNASITGWQVKYRKGSSGAWPWNDIDGSTATTTAHTVTGLDNDAAYQFRVRAKNNIGNGMQSEVVTATPRAGAAKPTGVVASPQAGGARLSWDAQSGLTGWAYQYGSRSSSGSSWGAWGTIYEIADGSRTGVVLTGLTDGHEYRFRVLARASGGSSVWSDHATATPGMVAAVAGAAVTVSKATLTVDEGGRGTYKVVLDVQPAGDVTITVGGISGDVTVDTNAGRAGNQSLLIFTPANWSVAQTVTVSAGEDPDAATDAKVTLTHTAAGGGYAAVTVASVEVTVRENDVAGVTVSRPALTVFEEGSGTYTVRLNSAPSANVTVTVAGTSGDVTVDTDAGTTGNQNTLTFTTANYATAQTVTVSAGEDGDTATDPDVTLTHSASGGGYGSVTIASVTVSVVEIDAPGVTISTAALTVPEGGRGNYTVRLNKAPTANVTITVGGTAGDVTVDTNSTMTGNQNTLTFTTTDFATAQTVTVAAAEDDDALVDAAVTLTHSSSSSDTGYGSSLSISSLAVSVTENDTPGVTLSTLALAVAEGDSSTYTVRLNTAPSAAVTVTVSGASGDVTVSGSPFRFTAANFSTPQTVTVAAAEDEDAAPDAAVVLTHAASGGDYGAVTVASVTVTVSDNDVAGQNEMSLTQSQAVLARAFAGLTGGIIEDQLLDDAPGGNALTLAGVSLPLGGGAEIRVQRVAQSSGLRSSHDEFGMRRIGVANLDELLTQSSFSLTAANGGRAAPVLRLWGQGSRTDYVRGSGELSVDGHVQTFGLGVDVTQDDLRGGVAYFRSSGTARSAVRGTHWYDTEVSGLQSVHPYVRWTAGEGLDVWGVLGIGKGKIRTVQVATAAPADESGRIRLRTVTVGVRGELPAWAGQGLALKGDATRTQLRTTLSTVPKTAVNRVRALLEWHTALPQADGSVVTPHVEGGFSRDDGGASGLVLGGGLSYVPGAGDWSWQVGGSLLRSRSDERLRERHLYAHVAYRPAAGLGVFGPALTLDVSRGTAGVGSTGAGTDAALTAAFAAPETATLGARLRYGHALDYGTGVLTPNVTVAWREDGGLPVYGTGMEYRLREEYRLDLRYEHQPGVERVNRLWLGGTLSW